ncbi:hypothetical protein U1Q18_041352 [Sarracenia purpurea var. burkii]
MTIWSAQLLVGRNFCPGDILVKRCHCTALIPCHGSCELRAREKRRGIESRLTILNGFETNTLFDEKQLCRRWSQNEGRSAE